MKHLKIIILFLMENYTKPTTTEALAMYVQYTYYFTKLKIKDFLIGS